MMRMEKKNYVGEWASILKDSGEALCKDCGVSSELDVGQWC